MICNSSETILLEVAGLCHRHYEGCSPCGQKSMRPRTRITLLTVVLVAAVLVLIIGLRKQAPPEPARLLPGADASVYLDLRWVRRATRLGKLPPVSLDPEYEQFVRETGFQFERDLDEAAFAIHYTGPLAAPDGSPRFTEVFLGRWNSQKVSEYFRKVAGSVENYNQVDIFNIPLEGRTLRIALLGVGTIAASNTNDPAVIREIIDRSHRLASPFGGPALLRSYYKRVPLGSLAWVIASNPSQLRNQQLNSLALPLDYRQLLSGSTVVVSVRFLLAIHFRAEAFFSNQAQASQVAERLASLVTVFHALEPTLTTGGTDQDVKKFFNSLQVKQSRERVALSAVVPPEFIKKVFTEPPAEPSAPAVAEPIAPPKKHKMRRRPK